MNFFVRLLALSKYKLFDLVAIKIQNFLLSYWNAEKYS